MMLDPQSDDDVQSAASSFEESLPLYAAPPAAPMLQGLTAAMSTMSRGPGETSTSILLGSLGSTGLNGLHPAQLDAVAQLVRSHGAGSLDVAALPDPAIPMSAAALFRQPVVGTWSTEMEPPSMSTSMAATGGSPSGAVSVASPSGALMAATGSASTTAGAMPTPQESEGVSTDSLSYMMSARAGPSPRFGHVAVALSDHRMLVHGGRNGDDYFDDLYVFSGATGRWTRIQPRDDRAPWPAGRSAHTLTVVGPRTVLMIGGATSHTETVSEVWELDTVDWSWRLVDDGPPHRPRLLPPPNPHGTDVAAPHTRAPVRMGRGGLAPRGFASPAGAGGGASPPMVQQTPPFGSVAAAAAGGPPPLALLAEDDGTPARPVGRKGHTAVRAGGGVLVYGGALVDSTGDTLVWRWDIATRRWSVKQQSTHAPPPRRYHVAEALPSGEMIIFGGQAVRDPPPGQARNAMIVGGQVMNDVHIYSPASDSWRPLATVGPLPPARMGATSVLRGDVLAVFDGADLRQVMRDSHFQLDLVTLTWARVVPGVMPKAKGTNRGTTTLVGNTLYLFGGHTGSECIGELAQVNLGPPTLRMLTARWLLKHHPAMLVGLHDVTRTASPQAMNSEAAMPLSASRRS